MKKIEFSENKIKNILKLYSDGQSCENISKIYNVSKIIITKIVREKGILRPGKSNGKKIKLLNEDLDKIKYLYLKENRNAEYIANNMGLTAGYVDKILSKSGFRRSVSEATSIARKGWKYSLETRKKISESNKNYSMSGNRVQSGGICKRYNVNNIKCVGTYEKFYIEKLINEKKILPKNAKMVKTPLGAYFPDFEFENKYIEIKCDYTYEILIGKKENNYTKKINTTQYEKIKWVNKNIKPVIILIVDKRNNKLIKKEIL